VLGEPPAALHPVVWVGAAVARIARGAPAGRRLQLLYGSLHVALIAGGSGLAGAVLARRARRWPSPVRALAQAALLKTTLSGRGLIEAARRVQLDLELGDLTAARSDARALVSRQTGMLDRPLLASAAVESIAENAVDSVIAPLLYYVLAGLPAALAYRAVNTMDAMIGYRGEYEYSGKVAARLDDLLNLLPARLTAGLLVLGAAFAGGDVAGAWRTLLRDHRRTESPNAGWPMSAMAGALGVRLEKPGAYTLGAPLPAADTAAIDQAAQLLLAATGLSLPVLWVLARRGEAARP
jgi:adenosylcobinamide-phosphate synthase